MNRIVFAICLMVALSAGIAFAEITSGLGHDTNSSQQGQHMMSGMSGHTMHHETMADMPDLISQTNQMLMKMTHAIPITHVTITEHENMKEMGGVMHEMAKVLNDLATSMDQGKMDKQALDVMHDRIKALQQKIDSPQKYPQSAP